MNFFIIFIQSVFLISLIFFVLFCYGEIFFLTIRKFINKKTIADYTIVTPLIGFSILIIVSNFFYFLFNLSSQYIYSIYLIIFILIFFILPNKKNLLKNFLKVLNKIIPIFSILIFITLLKGEQFYIFRGNYWDNMNYISQAILINDFLFSEILNFPNPFDHSYVQHGTGAANIRPLTTFFLAGFFHTNILNFFYLSFLFKFFLLSLVFLSFYFLTKQIKLKYNYLISLAFVSSFWTLYIFEIEALSHLNSLPFFLLSITLILKLKKDCLYRTIEDYAIFLLTNICFLFLYPEFFSIFTLVVSLFFLLNYNFSFFKKNFLVFIFLFFLFIIFTLPNYQTIYLPLITQIKIGTSSNINFWGYFSSFFIGKDNDYLDEQVITYVKYIFTNQNNFSYLFKEIYSIISQTGYNLIFLNLVPSFFGLYYLTISNFKNYSDIFIFALMIILNYFFIKISLKNLICVFNGRTIILRLVKSFILIFLIFAVLLMFNQGYWAFTKLYIYFGPIIFIFVFLNFSRKDNEEILSPNYWYIFLLLLFPFYKFYPENHGIGRLDSFPSIINPVYKKNINWNLDRSDLSSCKTVSIASKDPIINGYISIKLRYFGYVHSKFNNYKLDTSEFSIETNCTINLVDQFFFVNYAKK
jgi:hypothetical protein